MQLTHAEAEIFLNMIDGAPSIGDSSLSILEKIERSYPALIKNTKYVPIIKGYKTARANRKIAATAEIAKLIDAAHEALNEAAKIGKAAGVGFTFCLGDNDNNFDSTEGWSSSNC